MKMKAINNLKIEATVDGELYTLEQNHYGLFLIRHKDEASFEIFIDYNEVEDEVNKIGGDNYRTWRKAIRRKAQIEGNITFLEGRIIRYGLMNMWGIPNPYYKV